MNREKIIYQIAIAVSDVLDLENLELTEDSTAESVEGWDSLAHINIIIAIEQDFEIKFTLEEIGEFENIKKIVDSIEQKI
jgi:acyl carrier protein